MDDRPRAISETGRLCRHAALALTGGLFVMCCSSLLSFATEEGNDGKGSDGRGGEVELKEGYESWYRRKSANSWFGGSKFDQKDTKGKKPELALWLPKSDLAEIPVQERRDADRKIKARAVQLAMNTMINQDRFTRLNTALEQRLEAVYTPSATKGDTDQLTEPMVHSIIHKLVMNYMNTTKFGAEEMQKHLQEQTPEAKAQEDMREKAKDAAEKALDRDLEMANPKLKQEYEEEVQAHKLQNEQMDATARLLAALTNTTGWTPSDISQCGDHCDEVVEKDAMQKAIASELHSSAGAEGRQHAHSRR